MLEGQGSLGDFSRSKGAGRPHFLSLPDSLDAQTPAGTKIACHFLPSLITALHAHASVALPPPTHLNLIGIQGGCRFLLAADQCGTWLSLQD